MNFEKYIERIGYNGPKEASLEVLKQLQYRHLISIPFENLDIHYGHTITLDTQKFYTKIIDFGRGGFCYELNGLYNELLKHFGFETRIIQSRVFNKEGKFYHDAFGHLAIIATIDGQDYLTDVGFGEFITHPVPIIMDSAIEDPSGTYKIDRFDEELLLISKKTDEGWLPNYAFSTKKVDLDRFEYQCHYQQTSPKSNFTKKKVCSKMTENGRISLSNNSLKERIGAIIHETAVHSEEDFLQQLEKHFKIGTAQLKYL